MDENDIVKRYGEIRIYYLKEDKKEILESFFVYFIKM